MIRPVSEDQAPLWQQGVQKQGHLYHDWRWKKIIQDSYGLDPAYLGYWQAGQMIGGLTAFHFRNRLVSLPFLPQGGVWGNFPLQEWIHQNKASLFLKSLGEKGGAIQIGDPITMKLALPETAEMLWEALDAKTRNLIRKSQKFSFHVRKCELEEFYSVYQRATNALGTPPHGIVFFKNIVHHFRDQVRISLMDLDGEAVSTFFEIDYQLTRYDQWAFSLKSHFSKSPNMFLYWETLKSAMQDKIKIYDFGRSQMGAGTYQFKKQWGALPRPLNYFNFVGGEAKQFKTAVKTPAGPRFFSWAWKQLPHFLANRMGPRVRKYLV